MSDPTKKRQYDQFGESPGGAGFQGWPGGADFSGFAQNFDFGDLGGFGDVFDTFFGGRGQKRKSPENIKRGNDIEANLQVTFEEAVFGAQKKISVNRLLTCKACAGTGSATNKSVRCSACQGTGELKRTQRTILGSLTQVYVCDNCQGLGEKPERVCRECKGEGRKSKMEVIEVTIPAGIDNGQTIKMAGMGEAGWRDGRPGDLYINIRVLPHRDWERVGWDLRRIEQINYPIAVMGGKTKIKSLTGELTLTIPPGTHSGEVFRLKGKGIKHLDKSTYGDLLIKVEIAIPRHLTLRQKRLLEELQEELR